VALPRHSDLHSASGQHARYYVHSAIGTYFKLDIVPTVAGFDPMMQFIHEEDLAEAIALTLRERAARHLQRGGPGRGAAEDRDRGHRPPAHLDSRAARAPRDPPALSASRCTRFPPEALDFIKYPCTVCGERF
jgi:UDP-glucose 4-epimerase